MISFKIFYINIRIRNLLKFCFASLIALLPVITLGQQVNNFDDINIEAFSISSIPFTDIPSGKTANINLCYIDKYTNQQTNINVEAKQFALKKIEEEKKARNIQTLSSEDQEKLLSNSTTSEEFFKQHHDQLDKLRHNFVCRYNAKLLGLQKVPAVVFNRQYVIYGESDITQAYQVFYDFLLKHKQQKTSQESENAVS